MITNTPATHSIYQRHTATRNTITTSVFLQLQGDAIVSRESDSVSIFLEREHSAIISRESERERKLVMTLENSLQDSTCNLVKHIWNRLKSNTPGIIGLRIPVLDILDNGVMLTWDQGNYHLDAEIYLDQPIEFFFRNRHTNEVWNKEFLISEKFPENFLVYLSYFRL